MKFNNGSEQVEKFSELKENNVPLKADEKTDEKKWLFYVLIFSITAPFLSALFSDDRFMSLAPIDENAIQYLPLKKDGIWDAEIKKLGLDTIKKANTLLSEAAERVSHSSKCDRIINVMLNSERSKKDDVHIIVDCDNMTRFILNENEIKSKNTPKSLKEKMLAKEYENMSYCENLIKSSLLRPASYSYSFVNSGSNVTNLVTFVQIAFTAKNGFGLPLEHIAYCEFDDRGVLRFDIQN